MLRVMLLILLSSLLFNKTLPLYGLEVSQTATVKPTDPSPLKKRKNSNDILFGSFNIQSFGRHKMAQEETRDHIIDIIKKYDVVLIQEIRDKSEVAIYELVEYLKEKTGLSYDIALSRRLGDASHKEQLAYIYKTTKVETLYKYIPNDKKNLFYREPFVVKFRDKSSGKKFVSIGAHLSPQFVIKELEGLHDTARDIMEQWGSENIMIIGDLNASCDYINKDDLAFNSLRSPAFSWWITDEMDTTVHDTDCAYDRIITTQGLSEFVTVPGRPYNFSGDLRLTREQSLKVSDHYPVEIQFNFSN